jgi:hypothetical protein
MRVLVGLVVLTADRTAQHRFEVVDLAYLAEAATLEVGEHRKRPIAQQFLEHVEATLHMHELLGKRIGHIGLDAQLLFQLRNPVCASEPHPE